MHFINLTTAEGEQTLINMEMVVQIIENEGQGYTTILYPFEINNDYGLERVKESISQILSRL